MALDLTQFLFNRAWSIAIGLPGQPGKVYSSSLTESIPTSQPGIQGSSAVLTADGKPPTGLRVVFDIDKNSVGTSNKAHIEVYNFSPESRKNYRVGYQVAIKAGYQGAYSNIYIGEIPPGPGGCISKRQGSDIVTIFECGSAEQQLVYGHLDKSYPPGTKIAVILQDLCDALAATLGVVIGLQQQVFSNGYVVSGSISKSINTLLKDQGLEWSVNDNVLQIIPVGAHNQEAAVVLSSGFLPNQVNLSTISNEQLQFQGQNTGLIGVPSQGDGFITFIALLNPALQVGRPVLVVSENINGYFKIRRAHFEGDSHGDKWQVTCEAVAIKATQSLTQQNVNGKITVR